MDFGWHYPDVGLKLADPQSIFSTFFSIVSVNMLLQAPNPNRLVEFSLFQQTQASRDIPRAVNSNHEQQLGCL